MAAPFYGMIEEIRVMLVNHDKKFVTEMVDLLESYDYKVTTVDMAHTAMSILSKGKEKIDVLIINVHSPNSLCFQLLEQALHLNIVSIILCDEHNKLLAKKSFVDEAYLYLKKPLDDEIVKNLWQFVLRKKIQKEQGREGLETNGDKMNVDDIDNNNIIGDEEQTAETNMPINIEENNDIHDAEKEVISNERCKLRRKRCEKSTKKINVGESQSNETNKTNKRRVFISWTGDLQVKYLKALQQLGEGRCLPQNILEVMNVPGLTRMQVANHLQKGRSQNRRAPEERKNISQGSSSGSQQRSTFRQYGRMPFLQTNVPNKTQRTPEFPPISTDDIFSSSTQQQNLYCQQLQVQPHYLNPFLLAQNDVGGGVQQQYDPLFGMLGSKGPTIGSTYYRPDLTFNSGDYHDYSLDDHTENYNNLNLNAAHVTTYSGSAAHVTTYSSSAAHVTTYSSSTMKSDTDFGNATINELGAANANFQEYIAEQNMLDPSNIVAASNASGIEGNDSNEKEDWETYFNFDNIDDPYLNFGPTNATLPTEHGREFDQVYSNDQVATTPSVQFSGIANFPDQSST